MALQTESGSLLHGDWRSSAYGANKRAHLWVWQVLSGNKAPACGARIARDKTGAVSKRKLSDLCYDCLAHGASGR